MSEALEHIELIECYCEGRFSEPEKTAFESRLLTDDNLKKEFELYKIIVAGIKENGEDNLRASLKLADKELDAGNKIIELKKENNPNTKYWTIAASIVFIIGLGLVWSLQSITNLPHLADLYYENEKGLPVEMSATRAQMDEAMNAYKNGDYLAAKSKIEFLLKENAKNDTLNYFYGIVNYELTNYSVSLTAFNEITPGSRYYEKAQYRLILIDLKTNEKSEALKKIDACLLNRQHLYYEKLVQLRSELSK